MALTQNTVRNFKDVQTSAGTKTSHSVSVLNADGSKVIGMIQSWQPTRSRAVQRIFEVNMNTSGQAVDLVPGVVEDDTLSVTRMALWTADLFNAFSSSFTEATDWLQQKSPVQMQEVWTEPESNGIASDYTGSLKTAETGESAYADISEAAASGSRAGGGPKIITYFGCWFSEITPEAYVSNGDKAVSENATIYVLGRSYS
jgi:hypothetical protein